VPHIGDILNIANPVTYVSQIPDNHIEVDIAFGMSKVGVVVNSRATNIDPYFALFKGLEYLFLPGQSIVELKHMDTSLVEW